MDIPKQLKTVDALVKRFRIADVLILSTVPLPLLKYPADIRQIVVFLFTILSYNYFMFSFNDFMDKDKDYHDLTKRNRNPFLDNKYKKAALLLMALSGLFLLFVGLFSLHKLYLNIILFLIAFSYSAGIRAKNKPFLDVIFHGAWVVGMVVYGIVFFDATVTIKETALLFQFAIISTALELSQGIRDYDVDKNTNEDTTVVYLGLKATKILYASLIVAFSLGTPLLVENAYLRYLSLLFIPFYFLSKQETFEQRAIAINSSVILSAIIFLV